MDISSYQATKAMDTPAPGRSYRHGNLPNAMRAAARELLDDVGFDAVSLRETARRVGVSATAAYRHFASKEDLLASLAAEGFRELMASIESAANGSSDPAVKLGVAYVEFALHNRGMFRLMFGPILVDRAKYPSLNTAAGAAFDLIQRTVAGASEHPPEEDLPTISAWSLMHGLSSLLIDGLVPEARASGLAQDIMVRAAPMRSGDRTKP